MNNKAQRRKNTPKTLHKTTQYLHKTNSQNTAEKNSNICTKFTKNPPILLQTPPLLYLHKICTRPPQYLLMLPQYLHRICTKPSQSKTAQNHPNIYTKSLQKSAHSSAKSATP
ncbi:hypothetical protein U1Q18_001861 [Sarracenia purpurea var. burkii]